ncbi:hypothetical protein BKA65DRAFT_558521 [Rhexocercosporidium sp. MPI-PUGE-AT-0058]|nr:hypothetical protein BKA65DRAFT_558521 [Rhexocercosporidium sp. MPI-PUGE-AT-0058]
MFAFSFRSHGHVLDELPDFSGDFLSPFLQSTMQPLQSRRQVFNKRVIWAQAEMFVSHKLSLGCDPDYLEDRLQEEIDISSYTGEYDHLFLQYCLRILYNIRRVGQFTNFSQNCGAQDSKAVNEEVNANHMSSQRFADTTVVGRYGMDDEIEREIGQCDLLDKETEAILQEMRKKLHREAERIWHAVQAAEVLDDENDPYDPSHRRYSRSPSPRARGARRVEFPDEPTMTETLVSGSLGDWGAHTTYNLNRDHRRGRNRSRSASLPRGMKDDDGTRWGRSCSIRPRDSVSQLEPSYNHSRGADFSRLRPSSPPTTSNRSNDGFSSRVTSSQVSGPSEWEFVEEQPRTGLRRGSPHRPSNNLRNKVKELRVEGSDIRASGGRRKEGKRSDERENRARDSSLDSRSSEDTIVDQGRRKHHGRNASRGRANSNSERRIRNISRSKDAIIAAAGQKSHNFRGKKEEKFGQSKSRSDDPESRPIHRSDSQMTISQAHEQYESRDCFQLRPRLKLGDLEGRDTRYRSDSSPGRSSRKPNRHESRHQERSDFASYQLERSVICREDSHGKHFDPRAEQPSKASEHHESCHRDRSIPRTRHCPTRHDPEPPLAYDRYKNLEGTSSRDQRSPLSRGQSRPAATVITQTDSDTAEYFKNYRRHHSKRSNKNSPLKIG